MRNIRLILVSLYSPAYMYFHGSIAASRI